MASRGSTKPRGDGLVRRRKADGSVSYLARPIVDGRRYPAKTFSREGEAKAWKAGEEERLRTTRRRFSDETADSFADRWPKDYPFVKSGPTRGRQKAEGTNATNRYLLRPFIAQFRGVPMADIDRPMARAFAVLHPKSAVVARGMFNDALEDQLVAQNPFANMRLEQSRGRSKDRVLSPDDIDRLCQASLELHNEEYGPIFAACILFSAYVGPREESMYALRWSDIDLDKGEAHFQTVKFDKPYRAVILPNVVQSLTAMPRRLSPYVFTSKTGRRLTKGSHYAIWHAVRARAGIQETWHFATRHFCAHHFYVTLGFSDEEAGAQLGHASGEQVRRTYGHAQQDALVRLHEGVKGARVSGLRSTSEPQAPAEGAS